MSIKISRGFLKGKSMKSASYKPSSVQGAGRIRPTSSMTRCVLFDTLAHNPSLGFGGFDGVTMMDLCCGTGIMGAEFISLGAKRVIFVDGDYDALESVHGCLKQIGAESNAEMMLLKLPSPIACLNDADVIFFDPPYHQSNIINSQLETMSRFFSEQNNNTGEKEEGADLTLNPKADCKKIIIVEVEGRTNEPEVEGLRLEIVKNVTRKTKLLFYSVGN